jgi:hypothetical protein
VKNPVSFEITVPNPDTLQIEEDSNEFGRSFETLGASFMEQEIRKFNLDDTEVPRDFLGRSSS